MSDRDRFVGLAYKWLQNEDLIPQDRQFVVEYLLRYLKKQDFVKSYDAGDILDWKFTGDNIIFNNTEMTLLPGYMTINYDWIDVGELNQNSEIFDACVTDDTYVYIDAGITSGDWVIYRYTIATGVLEGIISVDDLGTGIFGTLGHRVALDDSGNLYCTSEYANGIWKWDGSTATQLAASITAGTSLGLNGDDIYVYYDGDLWHYSISTTTVTHLGTVNGDIIDIDFDSSNNVYFAGSFTTIVGNSISYVAKYTGGIAGSWSSLGDGPTGNKYSLTFDGSGKLYAGGNYLDVWDGIKWTDYDILDAGLYDMDYNSKTGVVATGNFETPYSFVFRFIDGKATGIGSGLPLRGAGVAITSNGDIYVSNRYVNGTNKPLSIYPYNDGSEILPFIPQNVDYLSTDDQLSADSDILYPSQSAVRDYAPKKKITTDSPTVDDDVSLDYRVGDVWIDTDG